jgi:nucleoside-diphosphate-sugar epimerase
LAKTILVTGASGFIGRALVDRLVEQGHQVYALYRHPPETLRASSSRYFLKGDVLADNLGIMDSLPSFDRLYHLAGIVNLGPDKDGMIYKTNVQGTANVLDFCVKHDIPHLLFCSTAYTQGRSPYEESKSVAELMVRKSDIPVKTVFKPSIVLGTAEYPYYGHFSQFASLIVRVHRRAEKIRRGAEDMLSLPVLRPVFRVKGNGEGNLNLIKVEDVVAKMAETTEPGICWLTNPSPPKLSYLLKLIGEAAMVEAVFEKDFSPNFVETQFSRLVRAFQPYLEGDDMPSDIEKCELTEEFLRWTINNQLEH